MKFSHERTEQTACKKQSLVNVLLFITLSQMSSTLSSIFSTNVISNHQKSANQLNLYELCATSSSTNTTPILASALNICYRNALLSLHQHVEHIDEQSVPKPTTTTTVIFDDTTEESFDATVFPNRSYTPLLTTISQWRHEALSGERFSSLLIQLVATEMRSTVLHWLELELKNVEEREGNHKAKTAELKKSIYELKDMRKAIQLDRLYELSENSKDVLIEQVDWRSIVTKIRRQGGFKYFDEHTLKRMWIHRCQYGVKSTWSDNEDQMLNQLVEEYGNGKWTDIAQHDLFQVGNRIGCVNATRRKDFYPFSRRIRNQHSCVHNDT